MSNNSSLIIKSLLLGSGGSKTEVLQIPLLSITSAPASPFAAGSKYFNSDDSLIYTAVTADTWTGAVTAAPAFYVIYTFDSNYYVWDGDTLELTDVTRFELKANKTNSYTSTSETTYPSSKGLSDGLATKAGQDTIVELKTNGIIGTTQYGGTITDDWNAIIKDGFYTSYSTAAGVPSADYSWFGLHQNSNVGTAAATQRLIAYNSSELIIYERVKTSSTWGSWFPAGGGGGGAYTTLRLIIAEDETVAPTGVDLSGATDIMVFLNGQLVEPNDGENQEDYGITTVEGESFITFNSAMSRDSKITIKYI